VTAVKGRLTGAALLVLAALAASALGGQPASASVTPGAGAPASPGPVICGQPILDSPWDYAGGASAFASGEYPGLPTFGSAGANFPNATAGIIVAPGNNTAAAIAADYQLNNTVVYFEPGQHDIEAGMYTGHGSAYVGGWDAGSGEAVISGVDGATNGTGVGGARLSESQASPNSNVDDTWEYLTVENYTSSRGNSVMGNVNGGSADDGDTYKYDTIGPNEYGYVSGTAAPATGQSSGGGYAIDGGNNTTIEYDCLTQDAEGAFNVVAGLNLRILNNEISEDGLGEYPDTTGPGGSPYSCGCSGGGKAFYTLNADIVNNYVHDNYNIGIWLDFDNAGAVISHNYIASNWGAGIQYEASYNASISDNTLTGNGWASDGAWPAGVGGDACSSNGVSCANGFGPVTGDGGGNPFGAIDLSDSGGNANLAAVSVPASITVPGCASSCTVPSRYSGHLLITGNALLNNFGGVKVYTDSNRYPGNIDGDSACDNPLGALRQPNNVTYYQQTKVLTTSADTSISGSVVASAGGTTTICANYGDNGSPNNTPAQVVTAPSSGMAAYNLTTGAYLGNIATVASAHSFTLNDSPGNVTGASLMVSAYGGCGPADYFGGALGTASGTPTADYWDNCNYGSRNVEVSGNELSTGSAAVTGCTTAANLCGFEYLSSFNAGVPVLMRFWSSMQSYITLATGGLGDVFADNAYTWDGLGGWQFTAGAFGNNNTDTLTQAQWQGSPNGQDAGSTFGS
jgi:parallel beta-helix repeat protein